MSEEAKAPVAIRVVRPYASEDEYLEHELECIARSGIVLVGAQQRPDGVVLRFEITLKTGEPLLRGEGRVVGFKPKAFGDAPGLAVRFTRLDSKSKALADRAHALREQRGLGRSGERPSVTPPSSPTGTRSVPPPPASMPTMSGPASVPKVPTGRPAASGPASASKVPATRPPGASRPPPLPSAALRTGAPPPLGTPRPPSASGVRAAPEAPAPATTPSGSAIAAAMPVEGVDPETTFVDDGAPSRVEAAHVAAKAVIAPPPRRDELLERLRVRARKLDAATVDAIAPKRREQDG